MRQLYSVFFAMLFSLMCLCSTAQDVTLVSAATSLSSDDPNATCFSLTPVNSIHVAGAVWNNETVDLTQNFTVTTKLYFGASDAAADGLAFVLQTNGSGTIGIDGGGLGYWQIPGPSFVIEFDTWQNLEAHFLTGDPAQDHIAFIKNADPFHGTGNTLQGPTAFASNIEDGLWHDAVFSWDAVLKRMSVTIFGTTYSYDGDIVNTIFGGNSQVYWGFTAGTGSIPGNMHGVCLTTPPPPPVDCGPLRTQTPGGWGAEPHGNNPGKYLHDHFASAFPTGLMVGIEPGYSVTFTSAQAITDYLPAGGNAKALTKDYTNPLTAELKNVLVNHLVALTLSVGFDADDADFGSGGVELGDMIIGSGAFAGWTVSNFLAEANKVLGGGTSSYTVQQVLETAGAINENYVDGKMDGGYLDCPEENQTGRMSQRRAISEISAVGAFGVQPNPTTGSFELRMNGKQPGVAQVQITNANGALVQSRTLTLNSGQSVRFDLSGQKAGLYIVRLITEQGVQTQKVIVQK